jgi:hypothetical protein
MTQESKMNRRQFCQATLAAAVSASIPTRYLIADTEAGSASALPDVHGFTVTGKEIELKGPAIAELRNSLRGQLLLNGDDGYDHARSVWNAMIDKRPGLIARCEGVADVVNCMNFARDSNLLLAVRGGGHSISGKSVCQGGLMIDMSNMNTARVDRNAAVLRADGGCLEGHIDREAAVFGLATTGGIVSHTGAAGLTLGGGFGRLCRKFGMACDNLVSADIVTVDGSHRQVSEDSEPDLFWALKGGGGNFGVVTALEYRLYEQQATVFAGDIVFDWADARPVLAYYAEHGSELPDELNMNVTLLTTKTGQRQIAVEAVWSGNPEGAERALEPLRRTARPVKDTVAPVRYTLFQTRGDNSNRHGIRQYMKSGMVSDFSEKLVDLVIDMYEPDPMSNFFFMQAGGAVSRIGPTDTAFPYRSAHSNMMRWNK